MNETLRSPPPTEVDAIMLMVCKAYKTAQRSSDWDEPRAAIRKIIRERDAAREELERAEADNQRLAELVRAASRLTLIGCDAQRKSISLAERAEAELDRVREYAARAALRQGDIILWAERSGDEYTRWQRARFDHWAKGGHAVAYPFGGRGHPCAVRVARSQIRECHSMPNDSNAAPGASELKYNTAETTEGHQAFANGSGIHLTYAKTSSDRARGISADRIDQ